MSLNSAAPSSFELELLRLHEQGIQHAGEDSWKRPAAASLDPKNSPLVFQQIEIDSYQCANDATTQAFNPFSGSIPAGGLPTMKLFGVTADQNSVLCHVHGFLPYIYIHCPSHCDNLPFCNQFAAALNASLAENKSNGSVISCEIVQRTSIFKYSPVGHQPFIRISMSSHQVLNTVTKWLENGFSHRFKNEDNTSGDQFRIAPCTTFESNIPLVLRFMVDAKIPGMSWVELPAGSYRLRNADTKISLCQYEADISFDALISHVPESSDPQWSRIAPLRVLSFDIECAGRKGSFPEANRDPVIQIATVLNVHGEEQPRSRTVFALDECAPIIGAHVISCKTEEELLMNFLNHFQLSDPDVVIGYNICNFDIGYLIDRAAALKLSDAFPFFGRLLGVPTRGQNTTFSSKAYGTRESRTYNFDGRLMFDIFQVIQRDYKLRSYSLNAVSAEFLNEQKEDVPHSIITDLQNGSPETRRRLAVYCLKDALLPLRIMDRQMCLINYVEMARVTGIPFSYILARGQQIKVLSQLYRRAAHDGLVVPAIASGGSGGNEEEQYEGATVIDPIKGYYDVPIATLDFASLYPSIMMAHNLCYTTLLDKEIIESAKLVENEDYICTPSNDYFVKSHVRKGILPIILEDLIAARKRAKADLKKETDPARRAVLDGRQLALKISANSVYGFTGATIGKLPCIPISQSTTAFGREMIEATKRYVETKFTKANGYEFDACVVYGDTDSVMVKFGCADLETSMTLGREAAQFVSSHFSRPISLEFEKCYFPYLLINKKRYAGLYWTKLEKYDKLDTKGIETVRRDNCRLVQTVIDTSLRKILIDRDVEGAKDYVKGVISDLLQNKIDLSQLVISKAMSKSGEQYAGKQAHVELAEKMRARDAATAPNLGDRVAYVIIRGSKGAAAYERAEDPIYVLDNNLPIDTQYYLDNQLSKPLMRIFEPILSNPNELLMGDHTRCVSIAAPVTGLMSKFVRKVESCLGCKASLKNSESLVCNYCKPQLPDIYLRHVEEMNTLEDRYSRLWTQCQRCQESVIQDVICTSKDCPIFYMRKKTQKDMQKAAELDEKFASIDW